ncbi:MAG: xanthine dehydrogenase family protein molybdopterin-binding subunit [Acidimicrobiales bacterium]|nr:MAG: xanthine dehydrogenase family protein molybdopterin-binding subunit [Acidimicrobiales bacterium]
MNKLFNTSPNLSRRSFIVATSDAGLSVGVLNACAPSEKPVDYSQLPPNPEVNAWVHIHHDDTVTVRIARSEMGQGTVTGLSQLVAEELGCDWDKVTFEFPTPGENQRRDRVWGSFSTGGSSGIRRSHQYVREGGAAARMMLTEAAANQWDVPVSECTVEKGVISHKGSRKSARFGELVVAASKLMPPTEFKLKDSKDWIISGKSKQRLDTADKLTGALKYASDLTFPGMLNASIKDCPILGGTLKSFDASVPEAMPGVKKVLQIDNAVVVVADTWWQANSALEATPIEWDGGKLASYSSDEINALLDDGLEASETFTGNKGGDVDAAMKAAAKTIEATYNFPTQNPATMEPMNATALWTPEKCEVWCPTQNGEAALRETVTASGHPIEKCDVYKTILGGGFGRRGMSDYVGQAVKIAKEMQGKHIKLQWSREEDMLHGFYHPITKCKLKGGLDVDGNITALDIKISGQSILAALMPQALVEGADYATFQGLLPAGLSDRLEDQTLKYSFPNFHIHHAMRNPPIRPGFWRGVNLNQNTLYLESFLDEMAHAAGEDALDFRLAMLKDEPKMAAVLKAAADKGGWGSNDGKHRGLANIYGFGSYVAACAEVSINNDGTVKINKITAATDPGHAVNPQQIAAQVEGSFVYGLSAMLFGEITYKDGQPEQRNFDTYNSMRIKDMPKVETIVMPSGGFWGGVGEPTIAVAAPAVVNAIFSATGKRVRKFPINNRDLRV